MQPSGSRFLTKAAIIAVIIVYSAFAGFVYLVSKINPPGESNLEVLIEPFVATSTVATTSVPVATTTGLVKAAAITAPPEPQLEVFKLKVPYYHQQYFNSCEAASLRMALGYYGIPVTDMDLVNTFGYKPRLKDVENNIWDDPQKMFVGFVDLNSSTGGYGIYGKPVARAAETYGRNAEYKTSITPAELAAEIKAGHPVVMWGYTSNVRPAYRWNLEEGGTAKAFHGEHARLIVGVYGDVKNPTGFYVHDSLVGAYVYWSKATLMKQFNAVPGVTNQVVIVR